MNTFESSRNREIHCPAHLAVIQGLAQDGGLFTPQSMNVTLDLETLLHCSYQEIAEKVIHTILDDYSQEEIHHCVTGAYDDKFDTKEIVPLTKIKDGYLMELWHGPTSAFKDIALTILPRLLTCAYKKENLTDEIAILTATSGDTGKAALAGFKDVEHTSITVFYPEVGVSNIQKRQMVTSLGNNVEVIAIHGNFDDCQRLIKQANASEEVKKALKGIRLSSANSINIGRLVPQIVYYFSSYVKLVNDKEITCGDEVNFVVPTGNFGDILAGYFAKTLGLPIHKLICASNSNNVLTDFINTGTYSIHRPFHTTISPSMDILVSSNLERLLYILSDYDDVLVKDMMQQLQEKGSYTVNDTMKSRIQENFVGYWTSEEDCKKTIHDTFHNENILIDPHTAVALHAYRAYKKDTNDEHQTVVLSTASPYKFTHDVLTSIGQEDIEDDFEAMEKLYEVSSMPIPKNLSSLKDMKVRFTKTIEIKDGISTIVDRLEGLQHDHD